MKKLLVYKEPGYWVVRFTERPTNHLYSPEGTKKPVVSGDTVSVFDESGKETKIDISDFTNMDGDKLNDKYF